MLLYLHTLAVPMAENGFSPLWDPPIKFNPFHARSPDELAYPNLTLIRSLLTFGLNQKRM